MVGFTKKNNIYRITRMTGSNDNFLGISFAENSQENSDPQIIEYEIGNPREYNKPLVKEEILEYVLKGLKVINQALGTNYRLSKIYYVPSSDGPSELYESLIKRLIRHYHEGNKFKERV